MGIKIIIKPKDQMILGKFFPKSNTPNIKTHEVLYALISIDELNVDFSNFTGYFPIQSSQDNSLRLSGFS